MIAGFICGLYIWWMHIAKAIAADTSPADLRLTIRQPASVSLAAQLLIELTKVSCPLCISRRLTMASSKSEQAW